MVSVATARRFAGTWKQDLAHEDSRVSLCESDALIAERLTAISTPGNQMFIMFRNVVKVPIQIFFATLLVTSVARGDLSSHGILSLDWLVDSSDEIHLVRYASSGSGDESTMTLKPVSGKSTLSEAALRDLRAGYRGVLLFVRRMADGRPKVVRSIDLHHPRASFRSAAFTREGQLIAEPEAVLAATRARIRLARRLPAGCDPFAIDDLTKLATSNGGQIAYEDLSPHGNPPPIAQHCLGGMLVKIGYDWSTEDWLCVAVVPVEPEDRDRMLQAAVLGDQYRGTPKYCHPVACLVNFPGEETEACLRRIVREERHGSPDAFLSARQAFTYLRYRSPATDPLNAKLVGSWRLEGRRERIDVDFAKDNTFTAQAYDFPDGLSRDDPRATWRGPGYWGVRDGRLSIFRSHAFSRLALAERTIFKDKRIKQVTDREVILEGGPPMLRRQ
jgi:hypothetical protein